MAIETGLEGKPWYVATGVAVALAAALVGGFYYLSIKGMKQEIAGLEQNLGELQKKINEGRAAQRSLEQFREEVQRLELELEKLLRILPPRRETPDLLRRIRALTEQGDLDLVRIQPGRMQAQEFYTAWPIQIQIQGTYHNLALLFDRIGRFSRIINIENLQISSLRATNERGHTIAASFTAKTFLYQEPEEGEEGEVATP